MLCEEVIYKSIDTVIARYANGKKDNERYLGHIQAFILPDGVEKVLLDVIYFLASYADGYYRSYGRCIGGDEVFGECWLNILVNMRGILFGGTGRLDGKTLDNMLLDMAWSQGFDISGLIPK